MPSYTGLRLREDSLTTIFGPDKYISGSEQYFTKRRIPLNNENTKRGGNSYPVMSVIVLSPHKRRSDMTIKLDLLSLREAFIEIANETFQLDSYDLGERRNHMETLGHFSTKVRTYRLSIPHDYSLLPLVHKKIMETIL
jgi:hypothetical protein